jgi:tetratricopeptide (TPR) repeat protein
MAQTTLRDYLQITEDAISSGRISDAQANCQHILSHFPEVLEAQRLLGEVYLAQGQLEEAQQTFDWVLTNDPENVIAYCSRALVSERLSDYDTALDCYQQAYEMSRGNSQIRQEFNQLSEKVGQQGFIFSRAGLARLYMRGDLLPQAIQEWESVLSSSPKRLDARIGLLEAYWREGLYDRVEQLAAQLLDEVPGCLKALLLLAHVTLPQNALQAQELMQRAKALDPDLVMAQELFSDLIVGHPKDPFATLLKKAPSAFPEKVATEEIASTGTNGTTTSPFSDPLTHWSSLDNIVEPHQDYQVPQEVSPPPETWHSKGTPEPDRWSSVTQDTDTPSVEEEPELWASLPSPQESNKNQTFIPDQADLEQPWHHMDVFEEPTVDPWSNLNNVEPVTPSWEDEDQKTELPAPPAWLGMLTREGPRQADMQAQPSPLDEQETLTFTEAPANQAKVETETGAQRPADEKNDRTEPFSFGPEWLKSLGAMPMDGALSSETETPTPPDLSAEPPAEDESPAVWKPPVASEAQETPAPESSPLEPEADDDEPPTVQPETKQKGALENWLDLAAQRLTQPGQNMLTTLEELENDLRTQGFTPLEPGTLSTIAQEQEPTLSSALAQLGNFGPQSTGELQLTQPAQPEMATPASPASPVESLWPATPSPVSQTGPQPVVNETQEQTPPAHLDELMRYTSSPATEPEDKDEAVADPIFDVAPPITPEISPAVSMDSELETTMKRPATRLQPMPQQPAAQAPQQSQAIPRGRPGERPASSKAAEGNLSYKERLLKGYQHQLAGAYDEAMQEYRIIIRNSPDLLGDVVSNMRALLKLAPKYSAGYRVLGDAYMRQGEYLQAMEAYNKALTMAKKAKS